jgi:hypothetical protein
MSNNAALVVVLATASCAAGVAAAGHGPSVFVTYRTPAAVVFQEPILVGVVLRNDSPHPVRLDLGFNRQANCC